MCLQEPRGGPENEHRQCQRCKMAVTFNGNQIKIQTLARKYCIEYPENNGTIIITYISCMSINKIVFINPV